MFGRKMKTKLPQNQKRKIGSDREEEARAKHDLKKSEQKEVFDKKQKAKEKKLNKGDGVLIKQKKTTLKSPWDPEEFRVVEVKGSAVTLKRGEETKTRAKNHVKVVEKRPKELETGRPAKKKRDPELDLEISWDRIRAMGDPQEEEEEQGPEHKEQEEEEDRKEKKAKGANPNKKKKKFKRANRSQEAQGGARGQVAEQEGARLLDNRVSNIFHHCPPPFSPMQTQVF